MKRKIVRILLFLIVLTLCQCQRIDKHEVTCKVYSIIPDIVEKAELEGWIARDKDGRLNLFYNTDKPYREDDEWVTNGQPLEYLPKDSYPSITWDSEPLKVKFLLVPITDETIRINQIKN
ncbi:MAG: hypothetical protein K2K97_01490 [Muribaculaceae bacterium]|nr:hypothetical protein [Muribaculaceae bacterium]